jgi:hypothetical protein
MTDSVAMLLIDQSTQHRHCLLYLQYSTCSTSYALCEHFESCGVGDFATVRSMSSGKQQ